VAGSWKREAGSSLSYSFCYEEINSKKKGRILIFITSHNLHLPASSFPTLLVAGSWKREAGSSLSYPFCYEEIDSKKKGRILIFYNLA